MRIKIGKYLITKTSKIFFFLKVTLTKYVIYQFNCNINIQLSAYSNYYSQEQNKLKKIRACQNLTIEMKAFKKMINIIIYENDIIII